MFKPSVSVVSLASFLFVAAPLAAQPVDSIGVRAQGMGGAFTAVADDATATWWNPAGMAGGAYFNALIESGKHNEPPEERTPAGDPLSAWRTDIRTIAVAFPAMGLSYYRLRLSEIQPLGSIAGSTAVRQEGGTTEVRLATTVLSQFGATVAQSLGSHFVLGTTAKIVSAGAVTLIQPASVASLDGADSIDPDGETHVGLDAGGMAVFGPLRIGLTIRNLTEPQFGTGAGSFALHRQGRLGAAFSTGTRGVIGTATVAVDG